MSCDVSCGWNLSEYFLNNSVADYYRRFHKHKSKWTARNHDFIVLLLNLNSMAP